MNVVDERRAHADVNMSLRGLKARKIEQLLDLDGTFVGGSLLEVGTGSGGIAHYFSHRRDLNLKVSAVDVKDNRQLIDGFDFQVVDGCILPFADASFDVVISNHVIEHVGDEASQLLHLRELWRVLKPGGRGYLAMPNRWMLVEPHFRLIFLSWLPRRWRSAYMNALGREGVYDCEPLSMGSLERLFSVAGVKSTNVCVEAVRATFTIERPGALLTRALAHFPSALLTMLRSWAPTLIYVIRR